MKTMLLKDGDLVPYRGEYVMVTGTGKVAQDIRGALLEPLANDRFHPGWGSTLDQHVGTIVNEDSRQEIEAEVNRVVTNLAAVQRDKIEADIHSDETSRFTTDEILSRVQAINVGTQTDSIVVDIRLQTVSGEIVVLTEAVF